MNVNEVKRPIGFEAWDESETKDIQKTDCYETLYDNKMSEYDNMLTGLIEENTKLRAKFLNEKRRRICAELEIIDLEEDVKKLKKKVKKLKAKKD